MLRYTINHLMSISNLWHVALEFRLKNENMELNTLLIKSNIDFGILTVINKMNYESIYDFVKYFHTMGVKKFVLNPILKLDGADNEINTDVLLENYLNLINYIDGVNNNICHPDDYISERGITTIIHSLFLNKSQQCYSLPCGAAMNLLACDSNGDIYPCDVFLIIMIL